MAISGEVGIYEGGHVAEDNVAGILGTARGSIPVSDYLPLVGEVKVGDGEETLRRDASMYMYGGLYIRHALSIPLPLSTIILARFLLVNTNIDNKI